MKTKFCFWKIPTASSCKTQTRITVTKVMLKLVFVFGRSMCYKNTDKTRAVKQFTAKVKSKYGDES